MVRISIHSLLLATLLVVFSLTSAYAVTSDNSIFYEDFNGGLGQWTLEDYGATLSIGGGFVNINSPSNVYGFDLYNASTLNFGAATEWVYEVKFRVNPGGLLTTMSINGWRMVTLLTGESQSPWARGKDIGLHLADGATSDKFRLTFGEWATWNEPQTVAELDRSTWYTALAHHKNDNTIDIYVDGYLRLNTPSLTGASKPPYIGMLDYSTTYGNFDVDYVSVGLPAPVPEPCSLLALACGTAGLLGAAVRRRRA